MSRWMRNQDKSQCQPLPQHMLGRGLALRGKGDEVVCCGSDERSMSGAKLLQDATVAPLDGTCLEQSYDKTCSE